VTPILSSIYLQKYEIAESYIKKAAKLQKDHPVLLQFMCGFYLRTGNFDKAEEILRKLRAANQNPKSIQFLQMILYALRGKREEVIKLNQTSSQAFAIINLKDQAISIMQKALRSNKDSFKYLYLINNPHYDNLRDDPRFQKIVLDAKKIYEERLRKYGDL
jgi:tetratricopeptide (TPR) repeat protein